jgi:hypothetical protein
VVHVGLVCKFVWCKPVEAHMYVVLVVVVPPCFDYVLGVSAAGKDELTHTHFANATLFICNPTLCKSYVSNLPRMLPRGRNLNALLPQ